MPESKEQGEASSKNITEDVQLKRGADGTYEPANKLEEEKAQRATVRPLPPKKRKRVTSNNEEQFVDGFRKGFGIIREIGKALKVKI